MLGIVANLSYSGPFIAGMTRSNLKNGTTGKGQSSTLIYVDESGIAGNSPFLGIGALKLRAEHGLLTNRLDLYRSRTGWQSEAHFASITRTTAYHHIEVARMLADTSARFRCAVIDCSGQRRHPFSNPRKAAWRIHAQLTIRHVSRVMFDDEMATVIVDKLTVPEEVNYDAYVNRAINAQLQRNAAVMTVRMDSASCWGLQLVDLLTGATVHQYRQAVDKSAKAGSPKGRVAAEVAAAFNLNGLVDADSPRFRTWLE